MTAHILTALYDEKGAAESARDDLGAMDIPAEDIAIRSGTALGDPFEADRFWHNIGAAVMPQADRFVCEEAVRRGGYLFVVRVPEDKADRAREILDHFDPIDLDECAAEWRRAGWKGQDETVAHGGEPVAVAPGGEPSLAHPSAPDDPVRAGGFGESIAYAAEPGGFGTVRRRVRTYPAGARGASG